MPGRHRTIEGIDLVDKVIDIDQSPIGRTPRSNAATYTGVFDHIRRLFSQTSEAKLRGYQPGRFSFNVSGGRCEACSGDGTIKIEMHFLPDIYVPCEVCAGARYNRDTLEVTWRGQNISEILNLSCADAVEVFAAQPVISRHLQTLVDVGLGYVRLGQPAPTLSGGEAQRVKLASELAKRSTGRTVYILDEPTTGLHFDDVRKLLSVLQRLVDQGNTVIVIEHNLDVIKSADWIIDLGPEGGNAVAATSSPKGTPEQDREGESESHRSLPEADARLVVRVVLRQRRPKAQVIASIRSSAMRAPSPTSSSTTMRLRTSPRTRPSSTHARCGASMRNIVEQGQTSGSSEVTWRSGCSAPSRCTRWISVAIPISVHRPGPR